MRIATEAHRRATYDGMLTKHDDPLELKADAESGVLTGLVSRYWEIDSYGEVTAPGAFTRSIADRGPKGADRILFRYEHEFSVGKHLDIRETEAGPYIEAQVVDDGMWGTALRRQLQAGVPYGLSIGFRRVSARPATHDDPLDWSRAPTAMLAYADPKDVTVLTEVRWLENSAVSFPACDSALIDSFRSDMEHLATRHVEALLRDHKNGRLTVEHRHALAQVLAGNDPETTPVAGSGRRNYMAELRLACFRAGVPFGE